MGGGENGKSKGFFSIADKVIKGLGGIGFAIGIIEGFAGLFNDKPEEKPQPLIMKVDLKATGTIDTSIPVGSVNKYLPGTDNLTFIQPTEIVYNNPLGVFNLLTTPSVYNNYSVYKLADKIKYIINPHSGLSQDKVDIEGQFVIELNTPSQLCTPPSGSFIKVNETTYATQFIPLNCLTDWIVRLGILASTDYSIYLRLVVNLYPVEQQYENIIISESPGVCISFYGINPQTGLYEPQTATGLSCINTRYIDYADLVYTTLSIGGTIYIVRVPVDKPITTHIGKFKLNKINASEDIFYDVNNTNTINNIPGSQLYTPQGYISSVQYNGGYYMVYTQCNA